MENIEVLVLLDVSGLEEEEKLNTKSLPGRI